MPTQVQIRGAATGTQAARTLGARELDIDTTKKRVNVHDGLTAGGMPHLTYVDAQNEEFTYALATGTNSIAFSLSKAPSAYAAGQRFSFKAANTITGAATVNVNGLGALTLKKKDVANGAIAAVVAGDVIAGGIYDVKVIDGSNAILESVDRGGGGQWRLISDNALSGLGTTIDFTVGSAKAYKVTWPMIALLNWGNLILKASINGGSSWLTMTGSAYTVGVAGRTPSDGSVNHTAAGTFQGEATFWMPSTAYQYKGWVYQSRYRQQSGNTPHLELGQVQVDTTSAINRIRLEGQSAFQANSYAQFWEMTA